MSEWGKLLSMIPKKAGQIAEVLERPAAEVVGDGIKTLDDIRGDQLELKHLANKKERAIDLMTDQHGRVGIEDFLLAKGEQRPNGYTDKDQAEYLQWAKELASEGFIKPNDWTANYGMKNAGLDPADQDLIGKLSMKSNTRGREGYKDLSAYAKELAAKHESGILLTPQEQEMFQIASDESRRFRRQFPNTSVGHVPSELPTPAGDVKAFPFKYDTLKKNITDPQPDVVTTEREMAIEDANEAWNAANDKAPYSPEESKAWSDLTRLKESPPIKRIKGVAAAPLAASGLTNPIDMIGEAAGQYDAWKQKLAMKVADAVDFSPSSARLPKEDKERQAELMSTLADPMNLIPGAAGWGTGFMQMLAKKPTP